MAATERIDRYLNGQMDEAEKAAFEQEVQTNPALAEELALHKSMERWLQKRQKRAALKVDLETLSDEFFSEKVEKGRVISMASRRRLILAVAASVVLLVIAWLALQPSLYEQYAVHPPLALVEKSDSDQQTLADAEQAFNKGNYRKATPLLQQYVSTHPGDELAVLYLGIAEMESNMLPEAREIFTSLSTSSSLEISDMARWYLALSFLKEGDNASCARVLQSIPQTSAYYQKANELLKRLND